VGEVVGCDCGDENVGGGVMGHDSCHAELCQGVGHTFGVGAPGPYPIASVMARGWSQVPTLYRVGGPCAVELMLFMNEYLGAQPDRGFWLKLKLKLNAPFICASAEIWGVIRERRRRFKVSTYCGSNLSQRWRGEHSWWNTDRR
jgi:hypothetical protein